MSWADVPGKLGQWQQEPYYKPNGVNDLVSEYGGRNGDYSTVPDVGNNRDEFEKSLDYYLGACINLRESRAIDPKKLIGSP